MIEFDGSSFKNVVFFSFLSFFGGGVVDLVRASDYRSFCPPGLSVSTPHSDQQIPALVTV